MKLLNIEINYSLSSPWIRPDRRYFYCPLGMSFASLQLPRLTIRFYRKPSSNRPLALLYHCPMLRLRPEPCISPKFDVFLSFRTQVVCISLTSLFFLLQNCFVVVMPCHRSRSFCQFSIPKSTLLLLQ